MRLFWLSGQGDTGNLGDLLGPIIVAAFTGRPVRWVPGRLRWPRLVTIGTMGHMQRSGTVHLWGTGFQGSNASRFRTQSDFVAPADTRFVAHAVRGPFSARLLHSAGIEVPPVYGDPAMLLPQLWSGAEVQKRWDLGVVLHLTESRALQEPEAPPEFRRYLIPPHLRDSVTLIDTQVPRTVQGVRERVEQMLACRRILSTSLHGVAIAEAYGIPCATFDFHPGESGRFDAADDGTDIDHRMRDFYAGAGAPDILVYRRMRHMETDWEAAMAFLDAHWRPLRYDPAPLAAAFPRRYGSLSATNIPARAEELERLAGLSFDRRKRLILSWLGL